MEYPYAMTVFYRKDRNPHGPSSRPILVATLEVMDYAAAAKKMGVQGIDMGGYAPVVQGLFTAKHRMNLGHFEGELNLERARQYFLNLIKQHLSLEGDPTRIGMIADIYGHSETRWPVQEMKQRNGCLTTVSVLVLLFIACSVAYL